MPLPVSSNCTLASWGGSRRWLCYSVCIGVVVRSFMFCWTVKNVGRKWRGVGVMDYHHWKSPSSPWSRMLIPHSILPNHTEGHRLNGHDTLSRKAGLRLGKDSDGVGVKNLLGQAVVWNTSGVRARTAVPCMGTWNAASRPARPVYRLRLKQKQKWTWAGRNIRAYLPNNVWKKWHRDRWKDISLDIN